MELSKSFFVEESTIFSDTTKYFDRQSNQILSRTVKTIAFLYVRNDYNEDKINHYILYDSFIIEYLNNQYDGVAGYRIRAIFPELYNIEDLKNYIKYNSNNNDLLLYVGTLNSNERESIQQLLIDSNKLLLSIHPAIGNQCFKNILQISFLFILFLIFSLISISYFGVLPQHYIFKVIAYWYKHTNNCIMIYNNNNEINQHIANYTLKYTKNIENYKCIDLFIPNNSNLTEIIENEIIKKYTDGAVLLTALDEETESFLIEMSNYTSDNNLYPIIITDYIEYKYFESQHKQYYENIYFTSSYSYHLNNEETQTMSDTITSYYGKPKELMTTTSLTLYSALKLFSESYINNNNNSDEIRYNMYDNIITTPMGKIDIDSSNLMRMHVMMIKIKNNDSEIILQSDYSYYESQYSDIVY